MNTLEGLRKAMKNECVVLKTTLDKVEFDRALTSLVELAMHYGYDTKLEVSELEKLHNDL